MKFLFTIILICLINKANAQIEAHYKYWDSGFCDKNIYLKIDGVFYYEEGCEGESKICKGRYILKDSTLFFNIDTSSSGRLTYFVYQPLAKKSDSISIEIIDMNENPLSGFKIGLLPIQEKEKPFMSDMVEADKNGVIKVPKKKFTHFVSQNDIEISSNTGRSIYWIEFKNNKNHYTIQFNYPLYCLMANRIDLYEDKLGPLVFKNGELYYKNSDIRFTKN